MVLFKFFSVCNDLLKISKINFAYAHFFAITIIQNNTIKQNYYLKFLAYYFIVYQPITLNQFQSFINSIHPFIGLLPSPKFKI